MAGTLTISTLSDGTNSTSSTNCIQGSAKAWINFDGTTSPGTIRAQYNVSSVTRNSTGNYTVNFTNALSDTNYSYFIQSQLSASATSPNTYNPTTGTLSTTSMTLLTYSDSTVQNNAIVCVSVFR